MSVGRPGHELEQLCDKRVMRLGNYIASLARDTTGWTSTIVWGIRRAIQAAILEDNAESAARRPSPEQERETPWSGMRCLEAAGRLNGRHILAARRNAMPMCECGHRLFLHRVVRDGDGPAYVRCEVGCDCHKFAARRPSPEQEET